MAFYSDEIIRELKQQANIADIIQQFVPLKRSGGGRFVGRCPFHNDHSPSMNVNPQMGFYKCFACGAGGDVFKFVMEHEKMDFKDAVEWVANASGFPLPELSKTAPEVAEKRTLARELNDLAADFFANELLKSEKAKAYLDSRRLNEETRKFFRIGYAPDGREGLLNLAAKNGFSPKQLIESGLAVERENGGIADKFRDRLMFAIENLSGKVVAFGGRILDKDKKAPKYLNSPDTALYKKGEILYGLSKSKTEISKEGAVILVEGYFDLISLYQAGVKNTVAASGTALTEKHAEILSRYTKTAYLVFDGDEAGRKATRRSIEILLPQGIIPKIVSLSRENGEKIDPDNFVNEHGDAAAEDFRAELSKAEDWLDHLSRITPTRTIEERAAFVKHLKSVILPIRDRELQNQYLRLISERYGTEANFAGIEPERERRRQVQEGVAPAEQREQVPWEALPPLEIRFVHLVIASESLWEAANVFFDLDFASSGVSLFSSEILDELLSAALADYAENNQINLIRLHDSLSTLPAQVLESFSEESWEKEAAQKEFLESLAELEIRTAERFRDALRARPATRETLQLRLELHRFAAKTIRSQLHCETDVTKNPNFFQELLNYRAKLVEFSGKI